jgi:cell volume regulation protein A
MDESQFILVAGALLTAGILASLLAGRVRLPALVLLIGMGMLLGSDGIGWIDFADYDLARLVGVLALVLILFEGGLAAGWPEIRPVLWPSLSLALAGTLVTAVVAGLAAAWLFDFSTTEGMLVGSILAATDGAAVFALLRGSSLRRRLARTLEAEAGLNDPVAVLLVIGFIDWLQKPGYGVLDMAGLFGRQLGIAAVFGLGIGWLATRAFVKVRLDTPGLYPVASIATAALAYGSAASLGGSGFMAVYLAGLTLGSSHIPARRTITTFHDGLAWVAQLSMFLILGLLVFPGQLGDVAFEATVLALVLVFVARPLAVGLSTVGFGYSPQEKVLLGWSGLRGAVPVVMATFPVIDHIPRSLEFFNIVFFAVLFSTVLQGSTVEVLARRLRLTTARPAVPSPVAETGTIRRLGAEVIEYSVSPEDAIVGKRIRELGLPRDALVNVIVRGPEAIPPRGSTVLEAGDRLHILVRHDAAPEVEALFDRWHAGPIGGGPEPRESRVPAY